MKRIPVLSVLAISFCCLALFTSQGALAADFKEQAYLSPSDSGARGESLVAISGDVVLLASGEADSAQGKVYVFTKPSTGWKGTVNESAILKASDAAATDRFGSTVAIDGDTIVVGALSKNSATGAAYIFEKPAGGWNGTVNEKAKLLASDGQAYDFLGSAVGIKGSVVAVGAYEKGVSSPDNYEGAIYVFIKPTAGWSGTLTQNAILTVSGAGTLDFMGTAVAVDTDLIVGGAYGVGNGGTAYVFKMPGSGWSGSVVQSATLVPSDPVSNQWFAHQLAVNNGVIVAGAPNRNNQAGTAYVFTTPSGGWTGVINQSATLTISSGISAFDGFGYGVSISGDTVAIEAAGLDTGSSSSGTGLVYTKPGAGWTGTISETQKIYSSTHSLGKSIAVYGTKIAIVCAGGVSLFSSDGGGGGSLAAPALKKPAAGASVKGAVQLSWGAVSGASSYQFQVRKNSAKGKNVMKKNVSSTKYKFSSLAKGTYAWRVCSCEGSSCTSCSAYRLFKVVRRR